MGMGGFPVLGPHPVITYYSRLCTQNKTLSISVEQGSTPSPSSADFQRIVLPSTGVQLPDSNCSGCSRVKGRLGPGSASTLTWDFAQMPNFSELPAPFHEVEKSLRFWCTLRRVLGNKSWACELNKGPLRGR